MDPISYKYRARRFPAEGPDRVCLVITVGKAAQRTLGLNTTQAREASSDLDLGALPVQLRTAAHESARLESIGITKPRDLAERDPYRPRANSTLRLRRR